MQVSGYWLAAALASELMHLRVLPDIVGERALDRAAASVREVLSVHLASGTDIHYAEDDRVLTIIGFLPDRASREDNRAKYTPEQSQIIMCRQAALNRKNPHKTPRKYRPF